MSKDMHYKAAFKNTTVITIIRADLKGAVIVLKVTPLYGPANVYIQTRWTSCPKNSSARFTTY